MPASHRPLGFGDDQPYLCKYSVFWSEKCKSDAKKSFDSNDSYISFATSYLIKIAMLLNEFSSAYLWSIGKFNLCLDPESSAWENICLVGKYFTFSLIDDAKIWIIIVKTLLHVSKALPELIIRLACLSLTALVCRIIFMEICYWLRADLCFHPGLRATKYP